MMSKIWLEERRKGGVIYPLQERTVLVWLRPCGRAASGVRTRIWASCGKATLKPGSKSRRGWPGRCPQCKRALLRGRGPKSKAAELRFQDLVADAESLRGDVLSGFAVAVPHVRGGEPLVAARGGGGRRRPRSRTEAPLFLQGLEPGQHLSGPHVVVVADRGGN